MYLWGKKITLLWSQITLFKGTLFGKKYWCFFSCGLERHGNFFNCRLMWFCQKMRWLRKLLVLWELWARMAQIGGDRNERSDGIVVDEKKGILWERSGVLDQNRKCCGCVRRKCGSEERPCCGCKGRPACGNCVCWCPCMRQCAPTCLVYYQGRASI